MYTVDDIKEECKEVAETAPFAEIYHSKWWVFPDGFHVNMNCYPTKEEALEIYRVAMG